MKRPEAICREIVTAMGGYTFYYGERPDQNFEADEFTYPAVFLDVPITAKVKNNISGFREATVTVALFFANKTEMDEDASDTDVEDVIQASWNAAREFVLRVRDYNSDIVKDVTEETVTDAFNVFDINLSGALLELTFVIKDNASTCIS